MLKELITTQDERIDANDAWDYLRIACNRLVEKNEDSYLIHCMTQGKLDIKWLEGKNLPMASKAMIDHNIGGYFLFCTTEQYGELVVNADTHNCEIVRDYDEYICCDDIDYVILEDRLTRNGSPIIEVKILPRGTSFSCRYQLGLLYGDGTFHKERLDSVVENATEVLLSINPEAPNTPEQTESTKEEKSILFELFEKPTDDESEKLEVWGTLRRACAHMPEEYDSFLVQCMKKDKVQTEWTYGPMLPVVSKAIMTDDVSDTKIDGYFLFCTTQQYGQLLVALGDHNEILVPNLYPTLKVNHPIYCEDIDYVILIDTTVCDGTTEIPNHQLVTFKMNVRTVKIINNGVSYDYRNNIGALNNQLEFDRDVIDLKKVDGVVSFPADNPITNMVPKLPYTLPDTVYVTPETARSSMVKYKIEETPTNQESHEWIQIPVASQEDVQSKMVPIIRRIPGSFMGQNDTVIEVFRKIIEYGTTWLRDSTNKPYQVTGKSVKHFGECGPNTEPLFLPVVLEFRCDDADKNYDPQYLVICSDTGFDFFLTKIKENAKKEPTLSYLYRVFLFAVTDGCGKDMFEITFKSPNHLELLVTIPENPITINIPKDKKLFIYGKEYDYLGYNLTKCNDMTPITPTENVIQIYEYLVIKGVTKYEEQDGIMTLAPIMAELINICNRTYGGYYELCYKESYRGSELNGAPYISIPMLLGFRNRDNHGDRIRYAFICTTESFHSFLVHAKHSNFLMGYEDLIDGVFQFVLMEQDDSDGVYRHHYLQDPAGLIEVQFGTTKAPMVMVTDTLSDILKDMGITDDRIKEMMEATLKAMGLTIKPIADSDGDSEKINFHVGEKISGPYGKKNPIMEAFREIERTVHQGMTHQQLKLLTNFMHQLNPVVKLLRKGTNHGTQEGNKRIANQLNSYLELCDLPTRFPEDGSLQLPSDVSIDDVVAQMMRVIHKNIASEEFQKKMIVTLANGHSKKDSNMDASIISVFDRLTPVILEPKEISIYDAFLQYIAAKSEKFPELHSDTVTRKITNNSILGHTIHQEGQLPFGVEIITGIRINPAIQPIKKNLLFLTQDQYTALTTYIGDITGDSMLYQYKETSYYLKDFWKIVLVEPNGYLNKPDILNVIDNYWWKEEPDDYAPYHAALSPEVISKVNSPETTESKEEFTVEEIQEKIHDLVTNRGCNIPEFLLVDYIHSINKYTLSGMVDWKKVGEAVKEYEKKRTKELEKKDKIKVQAIWEFEVDMEGFDPKYVDFPRLAIDLTKRELDDVLKKAELMADDFAFKIVD